MPLASLSGTTEVGILTSLSYAACLSQNIM